MAVFDLVHSHAFQVEVLGVTDGSSPEYFYRIEGLGSYVKMEDYLPGGANRTYARYITSETTDLVLTRPLVKGKTKITQWCEDAINKLKCQPTQAYIWVLDQKANPLAQWTIKEIYPKKISITHFSIQGQSNTGIGEEIWIGYSELERKK